MKYTWKWTGIRSCQPDPVRHNPSESVEKGVQMTNPFLGEIRMFAGDFAPLGWAFCNGQILSISQNTALFSLLGTLYGGNGTNTFALPDLRGRVPVHFGQGSGLSPYNEGQQGGSETVILTAPQLPAHTHVLNASTNAGDLPAPAAGTTVLAADGAGVTAGYTDNVTNLVALNPQSIGSTGSGQPVPVVQPYLSVNFIIALQGIFPSRS
jgi:microcystin-dependent protein